MDVRERVQRCFDDEPPAGQAYGEWADRVMAAADVADPAAWGPNVCIVAGSGETCDEGVALDVQRTASALTVRRARPSAPLVLCGLAGEATVDCMLGSLVLADCASSLAVRLCGVVTGRRIVVARCGGRVVLRLDALTQVGDVAVLDCAECEIVCASVNLAPRVLAANARVVLACADESAPACELDVAAVDCVGVIERMTCERYWACMHPRLHELRWFDQTELQLLRAYERSISKIAFAVFGASRR